MWLNHWEDGKEDFEADLTNYRNIIRGLWWHCDLNEVEKAQNRYNLPVNRVQQQPDNKLGQTYE